MKAKGVAMIEITNSATSNMFHQYSGSSIANHSLKTTQHIETNSVESKSLSKEDTQKIVEDLNKVSESVNASVKFAYNDKIGEVYISVIDKKTGEEVMKLPSDEVMKIKEAMKDLVGSLLDTKG
jgi:flagellar protein FlaG